MIVERISFQAKYGRGDDLVNLMKAFAKDVAPKVGANGAAMKRVYTDHTGPMFTVQAEIEYADLQAYTESTVSESGQYGSAAFQEWFGKMVECTERGERQLLNLEVL